MYEQYWGLAFPPFANRSGGREYYLSPLHEEALARLLYCVEQDKALALLHGPAGCGKSQLLQILAQKVRRSQRFFAAGNLANLTEREFLWQLQCQLGLGGLETDSLGRRWRRLRDFFQCTSESGLPTVLAWDNLDQAEETAVVAFRRLADLHNQSAARLSIILSLNHGKLSPAVKELFEIADMGIELRALEREQTESYVRTRLENSGGRRTVFQAAAIDQLQQITGGVPREINRLCDLALLAGMNESRTAIDGNLVIGISGEHKRL